MKKILIIISVLFFIGFTQMPVFSAEPGRQEKKDSAQLVVGSVSDYPPNTIKFIPEHKLIIFSDKDGIYAMSVQCTHKGCLLAFKKDKGIFACPCHGAQFSKDGSVARGPAKAGLAWYALKINKKKQLIVDRGQVVAAGTKYKF